MGGDKPRRYFLDRGSPVGAAVYPRPQGLEYRLIRISKAFIISIAKGLWY